MNSIPSLASADYGMGQMVLESVRAISNPSNESLDGLKGRNSSGFVYRMPEAADLPAFLKELSASKGTSKRLPVMAYSRARGITTLDPSEAVNVQGLQTFNEAALSHAKISVTWLEMSYAIYAIATDREAVETLMMGWHFYVANKRENHHHIPMKLMVGDKEHTATGFLIDPKSLFAADISMPEQKIFGLRADVTVHVPCLYGHIIDAPEDIRIGFDILQVD